MTLQQIIETVPHSLLEKVAEFCQDNEVRKVTINKADSHYKLELYSYDTVKYIL